MSTVHTKNCSVDSTSDCPDAASNVQNQKEPAESTASGQEEPDPSCVSPSHGSVVESDNAEVLCCNASR
jgi:hypothetical protein